MKPCVTFSGEGTQLILGVIYEASICKLLTSFINCNNQINDESKKSEVKNCEFSQLFQFHPAHLIAKPLSQTPSKKEDPTNHQLNQHD